MKLQIPVVWGPKTTLPTAVGEQNLGEMEAQQEAPWRLNLLRCLLSHSFIQCS